MTNVFYTSDLHFGHKRIHEFEPTRMALGDTLEERDQGLIDRWNAVVSPDDTTFVLGDVAMGDIAYSLELVKQLNGHKILIAGNHDRCWSHNKPGYADKWRDRYCEVGFAIEDEEIDSFIGSNRVKMCHFPYDGDSGNTDRYADIRPVDEGLPIVHGHVHGKWRVNGRQFNVGVDVHDYYPVHADAIAEWVDSL